MCILWVGFNQLILYLFWYQTDCLLGPVCNWSPRQNIALFFRNLCFSSPSCTMCCLRFKFWNSEILKYLAQPFWSWSVQKQNTVFGVEKYSVARVVRIPTWWGHGLLIYCILGLFKMEQLGSILSQQILEINVTKVLTIETVYLKKSEDRHFGPFCGVITYKLASEYCLKIHTCIKHYVL